MSGSELYGECETCGGPLRDSRGGRCRWCGSARPTPDQLDGYVQVFGGFTTFTPANYSPLPLVRTDAGRGSYEGGGRRQS